MTTNEKILALDKNHSEIAQCVYDLGIWRRVATDDGYKFRKNIIDEMRKLLDEIENLNEELK